MSWGTVGDASRGAAVLARLPPGVCWRWGKKGGEEAPRLGARAECGANGLAEVDAGGAGPRCVVAGDAGANGLRRVGEVTGAFASEGDAGANGLRRVGELASGGADAGLFADWVVAMLALVVCATSSPALALRAFLAFLAAFFASRSSSWRPPLPSSSTRVRFAGERADGGDAAIELSGAIATASLDVDACGWDGAASSSARAALAAFLAAFSAFRFRFSSFSRFFSALRF